VDISERYPNLKDFVRASNLKKSPSHDKLDVAIYRNGRFLLSGTVVKAIGNPAWVRLYHDEETSQDGTVFQIIVIHKVDEPSQNTYPLGKVSRSPSRILRARDLCDALHLDLSETRHYTPEIYNNALAIKLKAEPKGDDNSSSVDVSEAIANDKEKDEDRSEHEAAVVNGKEEHEDKGEHEEERRTNDAVKLIYQLKQMGFDDQLNDIEKLIEGMKVREKEEDKR
jgi:hypothetical protein